MISNKSAGALTPYQQLIVDEAVQSLSDCALANAQLGTKREFTRQGLPRLPCAVFNSLDDNAAHLYVERAPTSCIMHLINPRH